MNESLGLEKLAIIVLNYRTPELAIALVENLLDVVAKIEIPSKIYLIDGLSNDGSAEKFHALMAKDKWREFVCFVPLTVNKGYAYGNNAAIRLALDEFGARFFWILNPDTIPRAEALSELLDFMNSNGEDIVGSRLEDEDGTVQVSAFNFHTPSSEFVAGFKLGWLSRLLQNLVVPRPVPDLPEPVDWLAGASLLVHRSVFENIGLLDDKYFLYFEEEDFLMRAARAGHRCWYVPSSRVVHFVGASTGISNHRSIQPRRPKYWFESRRRFFLKNYGKSGAFIADIGFIIGYGLWRVRMWIMRRKLNEPPRFFLDFIMNSTLVKGTGID